MKTILAIPLLFLMAPTLFAGPLVYEGTAGPGKGKQIVFIASDHEYKSEEALPALARILAKHYGFQCTVLFGIDAKNGTIKPGESNIPGTEVLKTADLLVIFTRFQNLPAEQMQPIVDYLARGGPVIGLRTATHAFKIPAGSPFAKYDHNFKGEDFPGGFGRQILGETWVGHYGPNHKSSTRLDIVPAEAKHPILIGVKEMWAEIGAYNANPIEGSEILAMAQPLAGMKPDSPVDSSKKPMPGAWVRKYKGTSGTEGRVFASTYGASGDLTNDGFRRMIVNACFWALGMESAIKPDLDISFVGPYRPTWLGTNKRAALVKPEDLAGWDSPIWPEPKTTPPKVGKVSIQWLPKGHDYNYSGLGTPLVYSMNVQGRLTGIDGGAPLSEADVKSHIQLYLKSEEDKSLVVIDIAKPSETTMTIADSMIQRIAESVPAGKNLNVALRMNASK